MDNDGPTGIHVTSVPFATSAISEFYYITTVLMCIRLVPVRIVI
jgi:hypothetical protein